MLCGDVHLRDVCGVRRRDGDLMSCCDGDANNDANGIDSILYVVLLLRRSNFLLFVAVEAAGEETHATHRNAFLF